MTKSSFVKGTDLEEGVLEIEKLLKSLSVSPGTKVELIPRKLIYPKGVKHEIDLWINIEGYGLTLIECKNWKKTIGKNTVIEFAEKMRVTQAKKGYIVGKRFSKYAVIQADLYPEIPIELKLVKDDFDPALHFPHYHTVKNEIDGTKSFGAFEFYNDTPPHNPAFYNSNGIIISQNELSNTLLQIAVNQRMASEPTHQHIGEKYEIEYETKLDLADRNIRAYGCILSAAHIKVIFTVESQQPLISWKFQVQDKGMSIKYLSVLEPAQVTATFTRIS